MAGRTEFQKTEMQYAGQANHAPPVGLRPERGRCDAGVPVIVAR